MRLHSEHTTTGRQRAQILGFALGTQQAYEHLRLNGAALPAGRALSHLAILAWKFEAHAQVGDEGAKAEFVSAYTSAYLSSAQDVA
jgi:hypothetical protein